MNDHALAEQKSRKTALCPYCGKETRLDLPGDYRPVYAYCGLCGKKFIAERLAEGFQVLTIEGAPCFSDPECRAIEMGGGDEE